MRRLMLFLLVISLLPLPAHAGSRRPPEIIILWEGPVGEAAARTLSSHTTELGYPTKIAALPWEGRADLKIYVRTNLKERVAKFITQDTKKIEESIVTETTIDIHAENKKGVVLLEQHLNHPFAIRIEEGLDEAARNLTRSKLPEFEKKLDVALKNL